jgi:hypothetical protein
MSFYTSLHAFHAADDRRRASRERDFGLMWRGRGDATYRAAWVAETGELYVIRNGHGTVEVAERRFGLGELHAVLAGYQDVCGRRGSLGWLLDRLRHGRALAAAA